MRAYMSKRILLVIPMVLVLIIAAACGGGEDEITPTTAPTAAEAETTGPTPTATPEPVTQAADVGEAKAGGIIPMQQMGNPAHWNMWQCPSQSCIGPIGPMYNQIIEFDPETDDQNDITGDLAKSWDVSDDGMTYTFYLHENARWHDGNPVTAEDVVFSLDGIVDPDEPRPSSGQLRPYYAPGNARVIDQNTVEVTTQFRAAAFLPILSVDFMKIFPKHHAGTGINMKLPENQLGSGPYKLADFKKDITVKFTRNEDYFKEGLPYFDGMTYFIIVEHGTIMAAFKAGQVLMHAVMLSNLNNSEAMQLAEDMEGKGTVHWAGPVGMGTLAFNVTRSPYDDVNVRRAIYIALYRQPFIETFSLGMDFLGAPFPPNQWFSPTEEEIAQLPGFRETPEGEKHPDDIAEAKRLLTEAGYPDGFKMKIIAVTAAECVEIAELAADQLRSFLGLDVTVEPKEIGIWYDHLNSLDYQATSCGEALTVMDPDAVFGGLYLKNATRNYSHWEHPRIEEIFKLQARELDQEKRRALILEANKILMEEPSSQLGLYWSMRSWYVDNRIQNFHVPFSLYTQLKFEHLWCNPEC
jgi:peptide/nickel transport system substrate-binding protein